jgi:hypothetical protein
MGEGAVAVWISGAERDGERLANSRRSGDREGSLTVVDIGDGEKGRVD